ncbi:MAG: hypothetical protein ACE5NA_05715 [Nitrospiraceae bacterium]
MFSFRFIPFGVLVIAWLGLTPTPSASAIDGHEWMTFPSEKKTAYVMGVVDTWGMVTEVIEESGDSIGVSPDEYRKKDFTSTFYHKLTSCLREKSMGYAQVTALVESHLQEHSDQLPYSMTSNVWSALNEPCQSR